jgi:soluble lytic murein transglycosylase-like protein
MARLHHDETRVGWDNTQYTSSIDTIPLDQRQWIAEQLLIFGPKAAAKRLEVPRKRMTELAAHPLVKQAMTVARKQLFADACDTLIRGRRRAVHTLCKAMREAPEWKDRIAASKILLDQSVSYMEKFDMRNEIDELKRQLEHP